MNRVAESPGANNIQLKRWRKNAKQQMFWFDCKTKQVYSENWKNYCMEIQSNGGNKNLRMTSTCKSRWWNHFKVDNEFFVNEKGKVMDVDGGKDIENRNIIVWGKHGKINQQWDVIYVDEYPGEPKKGELNEKFGLYVERDFYIISELKSNRYLDIINNRNMVIKT
jgi:hypothetical protein